MRDGRWRRTDRQGERVSAQKVPRLTQVRVKSFEKVTSYRLSARGAPRVKEREPEKRGGPELGNVTLGSGDVCVLQSARWDIYITRCVWKLAGTRAPSPPRTHELYPRGQ